MKAPRCLDAIEGKSRAARLVLRDRIGRHYSTANAGQREATQSKIKSKEAGRLTILTVRDHLGGPTVPVNRTVGEE
jgi:hypothetical protein